MPCVCMRWIFVLCTFLGATGFSLFDRQTSYVEYEGLHTNIDGRFGVSFRLKTYVKAGLLFYVDDLGLGEYVTLYLQDGFLVLEINDGSRKLFKADSKMRVNDLEWHGVKVLIDSHHAVFRLNNATQAYFNITKMQLKSNLYVGGTPGDVDIFLLSHDELVFAPRFLGCVENVEFSSRAENFTLIRTDALRSAGIDVECKDTCKLNNPCRNLGVCVNMFAMAECLCAGTGHRGKICEKESPVVGIPLGNRRVTFAIDSSHVAASSEATSIFVRVRSTQPDGVFFYTAYDGDYILLELTKGRIAVSVNLGSGSVTVVTKKNTYNDDQWHRVKLERVKRLFNLTVDNLDISAGETRGAFYKFNLPNKKTRFILGGLPDNNKAMSLSRKKFTGCLQELIFNGYDIFWKFNNSAKEIKSRGKFLKSCPRTPTKRPKLATTQTSSTPFMGALKITKTMKITTSGQKVACILGGVSCEDKTTSGLISRAYVMTSLRVENVTASYILNNTSTGNRSYTNDQSVGTTHIQSILRPSYPKNSQAPFQNWTTEKNMETRKFSASKITYDVPRTTEKVIMASQNERVGRDLTFYFILAAVIGFVAFLLAILIIVKVSWGSKKKYTVNRKKYEQDYRADTGSFQRAAKLSKPFAS